MSPKLRVPQAVKVTLVTMPIQVPCLFARVLKKGGIFRFASDIDSYVNWTLLACAAHGGFAWEAAEADDWRKPYPGWPGTRYEAKALREQRKPAYLTFRRV